jgi:hypothetical protein
MRQPLSGQRQQVRDDKYKKHPTQKAQGEKFKR